MQKEIACIETLTFSGILIISPSKSRIVKLETFLCSSQLLCTRLRVPNHTFLFWSDDERHATQFLLQFLYIIPLRKLEQHRPESKKTRKITLDKKTRGWLRQYSRHGCVTDRLTYVEIELHVCKTTFSFVFHRASGISHKVERNVLNVSFQVNQYRSVIADLRNEISRLRTKLDEGRSKSSSGPHCSETPVNQIRDQIVGTFREQMKLR